MGQIFASYPLDIIASDNYCLIVEPIRYIAHVLLQRSASQPSASDQPFGHHVANRSTARNYALAIQQKRTFLHSSSRYHSIWQIFRHHLAKPVYSSRITALAIDLKWVVLHSSSRYRSIGLNISSSCNRPNTTAFGWPMENSSAS